MTLKEAYLENVEYWQESVKHWQQMVDTQSSSLKQEKKSSKRKIREELLKICEDCLKDGKANLNALLTKGEIQTSLDDGKEIAKWQKQAHPNQKSLPYREWKKKYGDKFTKSEYKEAK